jgi:TusA-related sulfurtransferase
MNGCFFEGSIRLAAPPVVPTALETARYRNHGGRERRRIMRGPRVVARRLDERGKVCPDPTFDTRMALNDMARGGLLEVVSDYYPARQTIPMLMAELGYPCEVIDGGQPVVRFIIRKV